MKSSHPPKKSIPLMPIKAHPEPFVRRALSDIQAYQNYLGSQYVMEYSILTNRIQILNMLKSAVDQALKTHSDDVLEYAYRDALQVILPNWYRTKSPLQTLLEKTLFDLNSGKIIFSAIKEEQQLADLKKLKTKIVNLKIVFEEKSRLYQDLREQNQQLWLQNQMIHGILVQCATKLGLDLPSIPQLNPAETQDSENNDLPLPSALINQDTFLPEDLVNNSTADLITEDINLSMM